MYPPEISKLATESPGYPNLPKIKENNLKSDLMRLIEGFLKRMNKYPKEI